MDILKIAAELFLQKTNANNVDSGSVIAGLKGLLGDSSGSIDLAGLVSKFGSSGLASLADSWLGDGKNDDLSAGQISDVLGKDKIAGFASSLGMSSDTAASGLAAMLPQIIDKSSAIVPVRDAGRQPGRCLRLPDEGRA